VTDEVLVSSPDADIDVVVDPVDDVIDPDTDEATDDVCDAASFASLPPHAEAISVTAHSPATTVVRRVAG
jgi:hypothetical protein